MQTNRLDQIMPTSRKILGGSALLNQMMNEDKWDRVTKLVIGEVIFQLNLNECDVIPKVTEEVRKYRVEQLIDG